MEMSEIITNCDLRSQSIELLRRRLRHSPYGHQLSLANRVHDFHARKRTASRPKRLEAQHRACDPFHRPMVLFHDVVEILGVANDDSRLVGPVVVLNRGRIRTTLINRDLLGQLLVPNRFA